MEFIKSKEIFRLKAKQKLPISIEEAWEFLSNPKNLKVITPDSMSFNTILGGEQSMYAGQIIAYTVSPLLGIKLSWVTEITHVQEPNYFVDEQRFGPYKLWHHKHFLEPIEGGVVMSDIIDYKPPFGFVGRLIHKPIIQPKLKEIFEYRQKKLIALFGEYE